MKFHFISSNTSEAIKAKEEYIKSYNQTDPDLADIIIPIGGDGILLKSLHDFNELNKPFFGINYGSVGFLMNSKSNKDLNAVVKNSKSTDLKPLKMTAKDEDDKIYEDNGVKIIVDKKSFLYLIGTTLEFSGGLNGKGFVFNNPNANRTCGCGESFSL